jgi:5-methylcytosine-specific restriction protein A
MCKDVGRVAKATVVDHVVPHNGDQGLFWDDGNWQALCATCHSMHKRRIETGVQQQVGEDGWPLDNAPRVRVPRRSPVRRYA